MDDSIVNQEWDYIIVGTGMGGSTIGHALAKSGHRVLFLEKGEDHLTNPGVLKGDYLESFLQNDNVDIVSAYRNSGRAYSEIWDNDHKITLQPFLGSGTGGSTALYGMVMERFWPEDFEPRKHHKDIDPESTLPERWPISFAELEPYYRQAESLYRVSCNTADPLRKDQTFQYLPGPQLEKKTARLNQFLIAKGLHPYRTPLACDWKSHCHFCQSFLCDQDCKNDSAKICLKPAIKDYNAALLSRCEVVRLEADATRVTGVVARYQGRTLILKGKKVILAMGALMTPIVLLRSFSNFWPQGLANRSGLIGKNLMRHYIDLLSIFSRSPFSKNQTLKELSLNDFYILAGQKYGTIGAFGHMPPSYIMVNDIEHGLSSKKSLCVPVFQKLKPLFSGFLRQLFARTGVFALILEDLPFMDNCVSWRENPAGLQVTVQYTIRNSEWQRIKRFRALAKNALFPNPTMLIPQADNLKFLAHASGTCRFGNDPTTSVLNKFNRCHDLENLTIVDSSFFPSAGGTNPGLTIAANALRVADHLTKDV